nr:hypothetical protein [uncultured Roseateles sp.]
MRTRYSAFNLFAAERREHSDWAPAWREVNEPKHHNNVIIIGGGHGLATVRRISCLKGMA